jgi:hypothetical protein
MAAPTALDKSRVLDLTGMAIKCNQIQDENGNVVDLTPAAAIASLTDNSAGTANGTIEAMANPTDTPATADALRDDLVAVLLPAIRNNVADLSAKINAILVALRDAGIIAT